MNLIRLLLREYTDLGPYYLQSSWADDKAGDFCCELQEKV